MTRGREEMEKRLLLCFSHLSRCSSATLAPPACQGAALSQGKGALLPSPHRTTLSKSLPLSGLSLPNSKMGRLDKMLTEEARDQLGIRHQMPQDFFLFSLFYFIFYLRGKAADNKGGKEFTGLILIM